MAIVYLQVAEELDQEGRHPLLLDTLRSDCLTADDLTPYGAVVADLPVGSGTDGRSLWALLVQHAKPELANALDAAGAVVLDVRPNALAGLSWELLERPASSPHAPLAFLDPQQAWSRGRWTDQTEVTDATLGPLRLLVVVCDARDPHLRADDELDGIHQAVKEVPGRIHLEVIDNSQSWAALRSEIEKRAPHVVHLIGHTRQLESGAVIEFSYMPDGVDGVGATWDLSAGVLRQSWPTGSHLVVLSACRTQAAAATGVKTLTDALRGRVPAVVGMRGDIRSEVAVVFARKFYSGLAEGHTVDAAVAAGRLEIFNTDDQRPDWSYPVLETRSPAALALPIRLGLTDSEEVEVHRISDFAKLAKFVDRAEQRRRTWWAIDAEGLPGAPPERSAVVITGPRGYGKTWLAHASMLICYLRGRRLHYVDLSGLSRDWLGTLRTLRDGVHGCELSRPMPAAVFGSFTTRLNWLLRYPPNVAMPSADAPAEEDLNEGFDPEPGQAAVRISMIFADFIMALEASARERPIVLAIDGIHEIDDISWKEYVMPRLIRPLVKGIPGVRMLLVVPDDLLVGRVPDDVAAVTERIKVGAFPLTQMPRLVREYGARNEWTKNQVQHTITFLRGILGSQVEPSFFGDLLKTLDMAALGAPNMVARGRQ